LLPARKRLNAGGKNRYTIYAANDQNLLSCCTKRTGARDRSGGRGTVPLQVVVSGLADQQGFAKNTRGVFRTAKGLVFKSGVLRIGYLGASGCRQVSGPLQEFSRNGAKNRAAGTKRSGKDRFAQQLIILQPAGAQSIFKSYSQPSTRYSRF
jgi:hypothetical protein